METVVFYFLKVTLASGLLFAYYFLLLRDSTFHRYNRFYLVSATVISFLLPLLKVDYFTVELRTDLFLLVNRFNQGSGQGTETHAYNITAAVALLVSVLLVVRLFLGVRKVMVLKKQYPKQDIGGVELYLTDLNEAPFSFFKSIFWKNSVSPSSDSGRRILRHELVHVQQRHSWDKLWLEMLAALCWFNPFFKIIKKELLLVHEYLADEEALKSGDASVFVQMLLDSSFTATALPVTNPFISSNLKKRLKMISSPKTKYSYARRISALPVLFAVAFVYMVDAKNRDIADINHEIETAVSAMKQDTIRPSARLESAEKIKSNSDKEAKSVAKKTIIMAEAERRAKEAEARFNSPEFKARIAEAERRAKEAEAKYSSPEFKAKIAEAERRAKEAEAKYSSPEFKAKIAEAERIVKEAEARFNSPEFKAKVMANQDRAYKAGQVDVRIFLNGKEISKEEMERLSPEMIEAINITKQGKDQGTINIYTKIK